MRLEKRLLRLEETLYKLEAEHYGAHWQQLWEQDGEAEKLLEEIEKLGEGSNPPYWFLPGKDEGERQFGWVLRNSQPAIALFSRLCDRLKRFVDRGASASVQPDSNASE